MNPQADAQSRRPLRQEPRRRQRRQRGRERQRLQPAHRRGLGSEGHRRLDVLGQRLEVRRRHQQRIADSSSAAGNPATLQWTYTGAAINPDRERGDAGRLGGGDPADVRVVRADSRGYCTSTAPSLTTLPGRVGQDSRTAWRRPTCSPMPSASAGSSATARWFAPTTRSATTRTSTRSGSTDRPGTVDRCVRQRRRSRGGREHQRPEAPLLGRDGVGDLPRQRAHRHRRQLHAVAAVGQLRRRERRQRSADLERLPVSGVPAGVVVHAGRRPERRSAPSLDDVDELRGAEDQRADAQRAGGSGQRAALRRGRHD